jgi:adenylyl cyclase-associated protein
MEIVACLSWVLIKPPPQTPAAFCKEAIASCTFWSNKIRKEFKGKDDKQIAFCDTLKAVGDDLVAYVTEYHKTGLTFNPKGVSLAEATVTLEDSAAAPDTGPKPPLSPSRKAAVGGGAGGISSLMSELQKKQTSDGASAATGLKKINKRGAKNTRAKSRVSFQIFQSLRMWLPSKRVVRRS